MSQAVRSPLSATTNVALVSTLVSAQIIALYARDFGVDVSEYFAGLPTISLFECMDSGYRFFFPFTLAGRDSLYRQLGRFPWFYQEDTWEHTVALGYLRRCRRILDVGCGTGNFLARANALPGARATGIELNPDSAQVARGRGLDVVGELMEVHA